MAVMGDRSDAAEARHCEDEKSGGGHAEEADGRGEEGADAEVLPQKEAAAGGGSHFLLTARRTSF